MNNRLNIYKHSSCPDRLNMQEHKINEVPQYFYKK